MAKIPFLEDIGKTASALAHERTISPLLPSFCVSWLLWNYRIITLIFSEMDISEKFIFIDTVLYGTPWDVWLKGVLGPLVTALAYIYLYPYPARAVYEHALARQRELRTARERIEEETPLTVEGSRALRNYYYVREKELLRQMGERDETIERLQANQKEEQTRLAAEADLSRKLKEARERIGVKEGLNLDDVDWSILKGLSAGEERGQSLIRESELRKLVPLAVTALRVKMQDLTDTNLIESGQVDQPDPWYRIRDLGRRAIVNRVKSPS